MTGGVEVKVNGQVQAGPNRITNNGLIFFAQMVAATATQSRIKAIAVATNATPTTATQTRLSGAEKRRRLVSLVRTGNVLTYTATFVGLAANIAEMGLFTASATGAGTMIARWLTAVIPLTTGDRMPVSWFVRFGTN